MTLDLAIGEPVGGCDKNAGQKLLILYIEDAYNPAGQRGGAGAVAHRVIKIVSKNSITRELSSEAISNKLPAKCRVSGRLVDI
jgi:hypothetical protein